MDHTMLDRETPPKLGTPFCRTAELKYITGLLEAPHGQAVLVDAGAGQGASTLLRAVGKWAGQRGPLLEIRATPALAAIPHGALHAAVHPCEPYARLTAVTMYRDIYAGFTRQGSAGVEGGLPIITVDGADFLDAESAGLVSDMVRARAVKAVLAHESTTELPEPLPELWINGMAELLTLQPLDAEATHEFCQEVLGGAVATASSWHIGWAAGGSPLLMRLMMAEAIETGKMGQSSGHWIMDPLFSPGGGRMAEALAHRLRGLGDSERNALDLVALSEPVEEGEVAAVVGRATVASLLGRGLVVQPAGEQGHLRMATPLFGQVIRATAPKMRSRTLHRQLLSGVGRRIDNPEALLRQTLWTLDSAERVSDSQLLRAATTACSLYQAENALRLAAAIALPENASWAACIRARAKYIAGDYIGAFHELPADRSRGGTLADLLRPVLQRELLQSMLQHPTDDSHADAAALRGHGAGLALADPGNRAAILRRCNELASLVDILAMSRDGDYTQMAEPLQRLLAAPVHPGEEEAALKRAVALALDAERLTAVGRPVDAKEQARAALAAPPVDGGAGLFLPELLVSRAQTATMADGDWLEMEEMLISMAAEGGRSTLGYSGSGSIARGFVLVRQGRMEEALAALDVGVEATVQQDPAQLHGFCTALAAYAAARLGQAKAAENYALMCHPNAGSYLLAAHAEAFLAAAHEHLKHDGGGLAALAQLADTAAAGGLPTIELHALVLSLDFAPAQGSARMLATAQRVQGRWSGALRQYAEAVGGGNVAVQLATARRLDSSRLHHHAAHMFAVAEATALKNKEGRLARAARAGAAQSLGEMGESAEPGGPPHLLAAAGIVLTRREREIVTFAAGGLSDAEIAEQLQLSVRTIEGHLYHSYAKLNITSRSQLRDALES